MKVQSTKQTSTIITTPVLQQPLVNITMPPLSLNVLEAAHATGLPPYAIREAIGNGSLRGRRAGRTYIVLLSDLQHWVETLDEVQPSPCFLKRAEARKESAA